VGVSISFVYDKASWSMLMEIASYFNIEMVKVETDDWDHVEDVIKKVVKSSAAAPDYKPNFATTNEIQM
jgi:ATP-dependent RNA helicase DDX19/DBP5